MHKGSCLCGAVRFTVSAPLKTGDACHCSQCRKQTGHYWASTNVNLIDVAIDGEDRLRWFQSSPKVERGFCGTCGSAMFWKPNTKPIISIALGTFDGPTGTKLSHHIFVANKGDYYEIADGLPQNAQ